MKFISLGMMSALAFGIVLLLCTNRAVAQGPASVIVPQRTTTPNTGVRPRTVKYPDVPSGIADAQIELVNGGGVRLARQKRVVILVDLWATWCLPCRDQMHRYQDLWNQYHPRGFEIIALSVGGSGGARESSESINRFAKQAGIKFLLGYSQPELTSEFFRLSRRGSIPQAILIGRDGKLHGVFAGGGSEHDRLLNDALNAALNE